MKKMISFALLLAAAVIFAACGAPPENKPANTTNTNANTSKPTTSAPTKEDLVALDKQANEAWKNHDTKFFETFLDDKFAGYGMKGRMDKATAIKDIAGHKCDVKSFAMDDTQMKMIGTEVAVLTYKVTTDGSCEGHKIEPARAASVFVKRGDKWLGAYHSETNIVEPKAPASDAKKSDAKADDTKKPDDSKKIGENKTAPGKAETAEKKPETKEPKTDADYAKPAANTATGAKPAGDAAMTDALVALEKSGWEAWKARDSKKLDEVTTKDLSLVDAMGAYSPDKASTLKAWTEPKCDIKSVNVSDPLSVSLTADVALLLFKGTAVGTCEGQKLGPLYGMTVFQKEGDNWKAAFIAETPVM